MHILFFLIIGILLIVIGYFVYKVLFRKEIFKLPLRDLGLDHVPAVPFVLRQIPGTLSKLSGRAHETRPAMLGLTQVLTIKGSIETG